MSTPADFAKLMHWCFDEFRNERDAPGMDGFMINTGLCADFANFALDRGARDMGAELITTVFDGERFTDSMPEGDAPAPGLHRRETHDHGVGGIYRHSWLMHGGRHYDAECLDGVASPFEMPTFRRAAVEKLREAHPEKLEQLADEHHWWSESIEMEAKFSKWYDKKYARPPLPTPAPARKPSRDRQP